MKLRSQILFIILGVVFLSQVVFGFMAYRHITDSRGDQLTIFLQYLTREVAEYITMPGNVDISEIYLEELRKKFSTPQSTLLIQKDNRVLYFAGDLQLSNDTLTQYLNLAYSESHSGVRGLIDIKGIQYYWAVSMLPDKEHELVMLQPAGDEEIKIATELKMRLGLSGFVVLCIGVWLSSILSSKISRTLDEKNHELEHLALHDKLTGLPNRTLMADRLDQVFLQAQRSSHTFALFIMDLDRFKEINDTLGHQFGDELLKKVSARLLDAIRDKDSIARLGGDEFAVLLPQTDLKGAIYCAERILKSMSNPFCINDVTTESKVSIGVSVFPGHGDTAHTLMQHADIAMYQAKKMKTGYAIYDAEQNKHSKLRLQLMNDLHDVVARNQIEVQYQPLINYDLKKVISVEVLARWNHRELGYIEPEKFIQMAEQMGLIRTLTLNILEQSFKDCELWRKEGNEIGLSLNLSTYCLQDLSLPKEIKILLDKYDVDAGCVELEITESALMHDLSRAGKIIKQLHDAGLHLAIDDFGTGFSSLNYLKNLPVDTLKIDKSFIQDMFESSSDSAIVKTIIELGHNLGCRIVAEGVENEKTLNGLRKLKVDVFQGYLFSKPLSVEKLASWLNDFSNEQLQIKEKAEKDFKIIKTLT